MNCFDDKKRVTHAMDHQPIFHINRLARYIFQLINMQILLVLILSPVVYADIYKYVDEQGVMHFSNTPTSSKYKLCIRENRGKNRHEGKRCSPDAFDSIIQRASKTHDVAFPLIKAVIRAESNFDPQAVSKVGAKGLMQLMDKNLRYYRITDPFDPVENIMGGTRYLKKMLKRFDGQLALALAAYNAGPTVVDRHKSIPPYKETRNYVRKVMQFHQDYAAAYKK